MWSGAPVEVAELLGLPVLKHDFPHGFFFIFMLLYRPPSLLTGRIALLVASLIIIGLSLPYHKAAAHALDYLIEPDS